MTVATRLECTRARRATCTPDDTTHTQMDTA